MPLPLIKTIKNIFAFKEPQPEPGFLLAGDEPEEVRETVSQPEQFACANPSFTFIAWSKSYR
jgi:hypothetical protein